MIDEKRPPRLWLRTSGRILIAGLLIAVLTGVATATLALHRIGTIAAEVFPAKNRIKTPKGLVAPVYDGRPQTFLLIGSDKRVGSKDAFDRQNPPHSDTLLLVRLDPKQGQTSVLSIPRDLLVHIEDKGQVYYPEKINAAYTIGSADGKAGGAKLAAETVKKLLKVQLNGIVDVTFKGFIDVVDALGCVYVNIDHRYWHTYSNEPGEDYSTIHLASGYQKLCYEKALSYVRYRHDDSDFVRVARQQDFIRQLREQVSLSNLTGQIDRISKAVGKAVITTFSSSPDELITLAKLIAFSQRKPLRQVKFKFASDNTMIEGLDYVTTTPELIEQTVHEFLHGGKKAQAGSSSSHAKGSGAGAGSSGSGSGGGKPKSGAKRKGRRHASRKSPPPSAVGLYPVSESTRSEVLKMATEVPFPVLMPTLQTGPAIPVESHRYKLKDRKGHVRHGFIEVFQQNPIGGYYDIEGVTWPNAPLISHASQTENIGKRHYIIVDDGPHIHVIAWHEGNVLYWVNNTLLEELTNAQMIYLAQSTKPLR